MWQVRWEWRLNGNTLASAVARRRIHGEERLTEAECRILEQLTGKAPDPELIPKRWGYGDPVEDDPFGDPAPQESDADARA